MKLFLSQGGYYGSGKQLNSMFAKVRRSWLLSFFAALHSTCHVAGGSLPALARRPSQLGISAPVPSRLVAELTVVIQALGQPWVVPASLQAGLCLPRSGSCGNWGFSPVSPLALQREIQPGHLQTLPRPWRGGTSLWVLLFLCVRTLFSGSLLLGPLCSVGLKPARLQHHNA